MAGAMAGILRAIAGMGHIAYIGGEARSAEGERSVPLRPRGYVGVGSWGWELGRSHGSQGRDKAGALLHSEALEPRILGRVGAGIWREAAHSEAAFLGFLNEMRRGGWVWLGDDLWERAILYIIVLRGLGLMLGERYSPTVARAGRKR